MRPCCCITLRTGGFLIGIFEIVTWSITLAVSVFGLVVTIFIDKSPEKFNKSSKFVNITSTESSDATSAGTEKPTLSPEQIQALVTVSYIVTSLYLILSAVRILNAAVLLIGIKKNNLHLVKIWFSIKILVLIFTICLFMTSVLTDKLRIGKILFYSANIGASVYFLWVIFALLGEMKTTLNNSRLPKQKP